MHVTRLYIYGDGPLPKIFNDNGSVRFSENVTGERPNAAFAGFKNLQEIRCVVAMVLPEIKQCNVLEARDLHDWSEKSDRLLFKGGTEIQSHVLPFGDYASVIEDCARNLGIAFEVAAARYVRVHDLRADHWKHYSVGKTIGNGLMIGYPPDIQAAIWAQRTLG